MKEEKLSFHGTLIDKLKGTVNLLSSSFILFEEKGVNRRRQMSGSRGTCVREAELPSEAQHCRIQYVFTDVE